MRCEESEESDEAHIICGVPLELILRQRHLSVFSIRTSLDDGTWWAKVGPTVHPLRRERRPRTHPYHFFVYCLVCAQTCPYVA